MLLRAREKDVPLPFQFATLRLFLTYNGEFFFSSRRNHETLRRFPGGFSDYVFDGALSTRARFFIDSSIPVTMPCPCCGYA